MSELETGLIAQLTQPTGIRQLPTLFKDRLTPPSKKGIYGWWFDAVPAIVPTRQAVDVNGWKLLYVGIAPVSPESHSNIRKRMRFHKRDDSSSSTLRRSLGCLLAVELGLRFRCIRERWQYGEDEPRPTAWMNAHAAVSWVQYPTPWKVESLFCKRLYLPLNLDCNEQCPFFPVLSNLRAEAKH